MSGRDVPEPRLQPGITPEHHARLAEANAAAKAYPGGPERLAQIIGAALSASVPGAPGPCCEEPEADPDLQAEAEL
jgi:hypothetical protein